jgi:multisubunit Na+/H+ antiporter MnhE subunit
MKINKANSTLFILLCIFWFHFTLDLSPLNIGIGVVVCLIITIISARTFADDKEPVLVIPNALVMSKYFLQLIYEIYLSSFINIMRIIKKDQDLVVVEVNLEVTNPLPITIIANSITLTPGTITVDSNESTLYVMAIRDDGMNGEGIRKDIKEKFEKHFLLKG